MSTRTFVVALVAVVAVVAIVAIGAGCARRVVIDPDEVHRHNTDWVLRPQVPGAPPAAAPTPSVPASDAGAPPPRTI
jgi:hypothetical protein